MPVPGEPLTQLLQSWLATTPVRAQRRFLETHPALLVSTSQTLLEAQLSIAPELPTGPLHEALLLLRDALARGGTVEAIRAAYVNVYGSLVLDLPPWLEALDDALIQKPLSSSAEQDGIDRVALVQAALVRATDEPDLAPEVLAGLYYALVLTWLTLPHAAQCQQADLMLGACEAALPAFPLAHYPRLSATLQHYRGLAHLARSQTGIHHTHEEAIACLQDALQVRTLEQFPVEYADTQRFLGRVYMERLAGNRGENLERAIACFEEALRVYTVEAFPRQYAATYTPLGYTYWQRIVGERRENLERAIACFYQALKVRPQEGSSQEYATTLHFLGTVYLDRVIGERRENLERAIACFHEVLQIRTPDATPHEYAQTQNILGWAYLERIAGARRENVEQAMACFREALTIRTPAASPVGYASTECNLGDAYLLRLEGKREENVEQAIACFQAALRVCPQANFYTYAEILQDIGKAYRARLVGDHQANLEQALSWFRQALVLWTAEGFPREHRLVQLEIAETEAARINWAGAYDAYAQAQRLERLLEAEGAGASGRDAVLREGRDAAVKAAFALTRLGQIEQAALVLEQGRARGLVEARALQSADSASIRDPERRARYLQALQALIEAQALLQTFPPPEMAEEERRHLDLARTASYRQAKTTFAAVVAEIRTAADPADFLDVPLDLAHLQEAAASGGPGHALTYLVATPWGGMALAVFPAQPALGLAARVEVLDLPQLTEALAQSLSETLLEESPDFAASSLAQILEGRALDLLRAWPGETFQEQAQALQAACQAAGTPSRLAQAIIEVFAEPAFHHLVTTPGTADRPAAQGILEETLLHRCLQLEVAQCLEPLAEAAVRPLVAWLHAREATSLTLIPCGPLSAFPLTAVPVRGEQSLGDVLPTSVTPSARALLREETALPARHGIAALGDTRPREQPLPWSEAEALTVAHLARSLGLPEEVGVKEKATREWIVARLQTCQVVDLACHGIFDTRDVLQSRLLLAKGATLTLGELLTHTIDLRGLRLLILSGCQTALLDQRGARDEVRSLAAGMVQAGARAVLATLWPVDDETAYLLVARFVQEWFPQMEEVAPAKALARAQRWLRTVTNQELRGWRAQVLPMRDLVEQAQQTPLSLSLQWQPEREMVPQEVSRGRLRGVRGRGLRLELPDAEWRVRTHARRQAPHAQPFADPIFWAGFQLMGW